MSNSLHETHFTAACVRVNITGCLHSDTVDSIISTTQTEFACNAVVSHMSYKHHRACMQGEAFRALPLSIFAA